MSKVFNIVVNKGKSPKDVFSKQSTAGEPKTLNNVIRILLGSDFQAREEPFIIETIEPVSGNSLKIFVEKIFYPYSALMRFSGYFETSVTVGDETEIMQFPMMGTIEGMDETFTGIFYLSD